MKGRLGQVWVETVVYTLIALIIIGSALAFVKPKLEELQDKSVLSQTSDLMENLNGVLLSAVQGGEGNVRTLDILIKKGQIDINSSSDSITFSMESSYQYGEIGQHLPSGNLISLTEKRGDEFKVLFSLDYSRYNLTYNGGENLGTISKSPTLQKISIKNKGKSGGGKLIIDIVTN